MLPGEDYDECLIHCRLLAYDDFADLGSDSFNQVLKLI
jgi:hypothetical protein